MILNRRITQLDVAIPPRTNTTAGQPALNIVDFATNPRFLGQRLFKRQATLLKIMTLEVEAFTEYDAAVIQQWTSGYRRVGDPGDLRWEGTEGTPGDLLARIEWCRANGRLWFDESLLIIGRRGSKNFCGAIFALWVTYNYLHRPELSQLAGARKMVIPVFAGNKRQATANQFGDIRTLVDAAPCFQSLLVTSTTSDSVRLRGPSGAGIELAAKETGVNSARGPATPMLLLDEIAHLAGAGSTASSTQLYEAAYPALAQFGRHAASLQTSSPWDRFGQLFVSFERACRIDPVTEAAVEPSKFTLQLPSWALYDDAHTKLDTPMWPGGPLFADPGPPPIQLDSRLRQEEAANPDAFAVEMRGQWRSSLDAYLQQAFVSRLFGPYEGSLLQQQTHGRLNVVYAAHGDPSKSQCNFGFAVAHRELDDEDQVHIVFDIIKAWRPSEFPDGIVNYRTIEQEILGYVKDFHIADLTFDQFNSLSTIQNLQIAADQANGIGRTRVFERTATATHNLDAWEIFKTALGHGIVHAPPHGLAQAELEALQLVNGKVVRPTSGPTRTKDVADAMANVVFTLLAEDASAVFAKLATTPLKGSVPGGTYVAAAEPTIPEQLSRAGRASRPTPGVPRGPRRTPAQGQRFHRGRPQGGRPW